MIELAAILVLGIFAQWMAWRVQQPAILPLILIGVAVGPFSTFFTPEGEKLIDPDRIFQGDMMYYFVSLSVGVILFEGGLSLKIRELRGVASTVRNLLIASTVITFIGGGLATYYIMGLNLKVAFLFGAIIIVTGPTVIAPIMRNVNPKKSVGTILKWESIIIDPIGALAAVLVYEFILSGKGGDQLTLFAIRGFIETVGVGLLAGLFFSWVLYVLIKRDWMPEYLINVVTLGIVILAFALADMLKPESGLLAVTLMGIVLANLNIKELNTIVHFKESLTLILLSILFIILSAHITIEQLAMLGWKSLIVFAIVVFLLRPLSVVVSTIGSGLNWREKLFLSWIGPRGIVAAAIASIISLNLVNKGALPPPQIQEAELLIPLTFLMILGTVVLQGSTAKKMAEWLNVVQKESRGILIIGANEAARLIARYIKSMDINVITVDSSPANVVEAKKQEIPALERNVIADDVGLELEYENFGSILALTSSNDINIISCRIFGAQFGEKNVYRLNTRNEIKYGSALQPYNKLFGSKVDYIRLMRTVHEYPYIHIRKLASKQMLNRYLKFMDGASIPLFLRTHDNRLKVIPANHEVIFEEGDELIYLGKEITFPEETTDEPVDASTESVPATE